LKAVRRAHSSRQDVLILNHLQTCGHGFECFCFSEAATAIDHDGLTGTKTRRFFWSFYQRVKRASRSVERSLVVLIVSTNQGSE